MIQPASPNMDSDSLGDQDAARGKGSPHTGRKSANNAFSHQQQMSTETSPKRSPANESNLREASLLRRQLLQDDSSDGSDGRRDRSITESVASWRTRRIVPDGSAKPLGDADAGR